MSNTKLDYPNTLEELTSVMDMVESLAVEIPVAESSGHPKLTGVNVTLLPHAFKLPEYQSALASGVDLYAANDENVMLNGIGVTKIIPTGVCLEIPEGYEAQVRSRSGLAAKNSIVVTNSPGTIDADYRGEIKVILTNIGGRRFTVERGMRIAQLVFTPVVSAELNLVTELYDTTRGKKGFGSTGMS